MSTDRDDEKGFKVTDRRQFSGDAPAAEAPAPEPPAAPAPPADAAPPPDDAQAPPRPSGTARSGPLPEIDFATFILSLGTSALYHLGEMPRPDADAPAKNLPLAKQTIDIIAMLQVKSKGNLTEGEDQLLDSLLYDLRMKYVAATAK